VLYSLVSYFPVKSVHVRLEVTNTQLAIGRQKISRVEELANNWNPISITVPCQELLGQMENLRVCEWARYKGIFATARK